MSAVRAGGFERAIGRFGGVGEDGGVGGWDGWDWMGGGFGLGCWGCTGEMGSRPWDGDIFRGFYLIVYEVVNF